MDAGHNIILEIEIDGALNVKKLYPDALLIFLLPQASKSLKSVLESVELKVKMLLQTELRELLRNQKSHKRI